MNIGNKLIELRKKKGLSQENVADILNVSRQTVSKWELDQSMPDFDKIIPLCNLYEISADELLRGVKEEKNEKIETKEYSYDEKVDYKNNRHKRALGISIGVFLYFLAVVSIMVMIPVLRINPILSAAIFLIICGLATLSIVYVCLNYKVEASEKETKEKKLEDSINSIIATIILIIYLILSFLSGAWHITWILWVIYALITSIVKLLLMLRGEENEEK